MSEKKSVYRFENRSLTLTSQSVDDLTQVVRSFNRKRTVVEFLKALHRPSHKSRAIALLYFGI